MSPLIKYAIGISLLALILLALMSFHLASSYQCLKQYGHDNLSTDEAKALMDKCAANVHSGEETAPFTTQS